MSVSSLSKQWHSAPAASPRSEAPSVTFTGQGQQSSKTPSYAETTWIRVDEATRKALKPYKRCTIKSWVGKNLNQVLSGTENRISVHDARIINSKAAKQVFQISAENVLEFTVDQTIRNRLDRIALDCDLKSISADLKLPFTELINLKTEKGPRSIVVEHARKYNTYFHQKLGWSADLFDLERILNLANNEPIAEKIRKLSEEAFIKIKPENKNQIKELNMPIKRQINAIKGTNFITNITNSKQVISINDAVFISKISGKIIFDLQETNLEKFSVHPDHINQLDQFIQDAEEEGREIDEKIRNKISGFKKLRAASISPEEAKQLSSYLGKNLFDFESILAHAEQDAEEEIKKLPDLSTSFKATKRPITDSTASSEAPIVQSSKRQRTANYNQGPLPEAAPQQLASPFDFTSSKQTSRSHDNSTSKHPSTISIPYFNTQVDVSSGTSDPSIQEMFPIPFMYEDWDLPNENLS